MPARHNCGKWKVSGSGCASKKPSSSGTPTIAGKSPGLNSTECLRFLTWGGAHAVRQIMGTCGTCRLALDDCRIQRTSGRCIRGSCDSDLERGPSPETNAQD